MDGLNITNIHTLLNLNRRESIIQPKVGAKRLLWVAVAVNLFYAERVEWSA